MENRYLFLRLRLGMRLREMWFRDKSGEKEFIGSDGNASVVSDSSSGADLAD